MGAPKKFEEYLEHLCGGLGHADRHAGLRDYCAGLMLPLARKSMEPIAARLDPLHASARHQSLQHFVAKADWSDEEMLRRVAQWVLPKLDLSEGGYWIIDDTSFPKKGKHSVGVARQYCGVLGKQDNCQVAVSLSLANEKGRLPVAYQLYLPREWAEDPARRNRAGVPEQIQFATKPQIAAKQLQHLLDQGAPKCCVLADAGYGVDHAFRDRLTQMGLSYVVGITSAVVVWPPGVEPLPAKAWSGKGRPPVVPQRTRTRQPLSVKTLALSLPTKAFQSISWRQGTNEPLRGRFAAVRVRHGGGNVGRARLHPQQWLLIEWPLGHSEPLKYYLSTLPEDTPLDELVSAAHMRWRIERDYQEMKQELGLGHYEGRGWRGFHHHASLCIAAYGFLISQRTHPNQSIGAKKNSINLQAPAVPDDYIPRGSPARPAARVSVHRDHPISPQRSDQPKTTSLPLLRTNTCSIQ